MEDKLTTIKRRIPKILQIMVFIAVSLLVLPSVSVVPVRTPTYIAAGGAEDVRLSLDLDFFRYLDSDPDWYADHANSTNGMNLTYSETSGTYYSTGYLYTRCAANSAEYANRNITYTSATTSAMWEMMYEAVDKDAEDVFQMNLTLNRTSHAYDFDNLAIGNEYNVPTVWYKNATDNQTIDLGFTFEQGVSYIAILYINANYTADAEMRWKSNGTVAGSAHISALNLSSPANVTLMNLSNANGAGGGGNSYRVEYAFYMGDTDFDLVDNSDNTRLGDTTPSGDEEMKRWLFRQSIDADLSTDWGNMSGGANMSEALVDSSDYFNNGQSIPTDITNFQKTNDSWYNPRDLKHLCAMIPEKNESYNHREAYEYHWGDDFQKTIFNDIRAQYNYDEDAGMFVDHRVENLNLTVTFSDTFADQVRQDFWEGVKGSNADIEASFFTQNAEAGMFDSISGSWNNIMDGAGDGLGNVYDNSFGMLGASAMGAGEWATSGFLGFGDSVGNGISGFFTATNAAIGNIVSGASQFIVNGGKFLLTTAFQLLKLPFSLLMMLTGKIHWTIIFVIFVIIVLAVVFFYYRKHPQAFKRGGSKKIGTKA